MYIEFLEGSPLWYWYNYGGVIAGMAVTVIVAAMLIGLSSWKAEGIFVKTLGVASLVTVMPLGLARLGFRMAISNPELVGYLSIGGTAVILVTGLIFFASRSGKNSNKVQVAAPAVNKKEAREAVRSEKKEVPNLKTDNELTIHMKDDKKVSVNSETVTIGRSPDNTIVIDDPSVSRKHARITRKGDGYYLEDLNSTNGVTIDGVSVDGKEIEQGAVVKLGKIEIGVGSPMIDTKLHEENREKESNISDPMENTYMGTPKPNRVGWLTVNGGKNAGDVFYLNPGDYDRVKVTKGSSLRPTDPYFTQIEILYQMNISLLGSHERWSGGWATHINPDGGRDLLQVGTIRSFKKTWCMTRPDDIILDEMYEELSLLWDTLLSEVPFISDRSAHLRATNTITVEDDDEDTMQMAHALMYPVLQPMITKLARALIDKATADQGVSDLTEEFLKQALAPLKNIDWDLHNAPWKYLILIQGDNESWSVRNETRTPAIIRLESLLRWMLGIDSLSEDAIETARLGWRDSPGLLPPGLNPIPEEQIEEMWNSILETATVNNEM